MFAHLGSETTAARIFCLFLSGNTPPDATLLARMGQKRRMVWVEAAAGAAGAAVDAGEGTGAGAGARMAAGAVETTETLDTSGSGCSGSSGRLANGQRGRGGGGDGGGRSDGGWIGSSGSNQGGKRRRNASEAPPRRPAPSEQRAGMVSAAHWAYTSPHCLGRPVELGPGDPAESRKPKTSGGRGRKWQNGGGMREQQRKQHHFRYIEGGVGLVDSARAENNARAVDENYRILKNGGKNGGDTAAYTPLMQLRRKSKPKSEIPAMNKALSRNSLQLLRRITRSSVTAFAAALSASLMGFRSSVAYFNLPLSSCARAALTPRPILSTCVIKPRLGNELVAAFARCSPCCSG